MRTAKRRLAKLLAHPVVWALIYGALLAYGVHALTAIPVEVLPPFNFPQIGVIAHQPGAGARQLEALVVRPLEGRLLSLPNMQSVHSVMGRGSAEIDVRFREGTSEQLDLQAVQGAIDRARSELPRSVHPYAQVMGNAINEVADYALAIPPEQDPATVQRMVRTRIVPALRAIPGIRRVEVYGAGDEALWIQPNLQALQRYGVSPAALAQAVRAQVLLRPGGYLSLGHQDVLLEARNLPTHAAQLAQVPVPAAHGPIPLDALARVVRSAVPIHSAILLDGHPAVALTVFKQADASTVPVTEAVARTLASLRSELPAGVRWVRIYSQGHLVHLVGADLGRNLLIGAGLAIGVLIWVLGAARGIWTLAVSIPLSLLLGIAGLYFAGQTLNLMTLGALTIAVGMLADDAIIVLESIYHRWEQGDSRWGGIRRGMRDIAIPDVTGTLTTVAVYVPLVFVGGLAGLFFVPFALAMTLALLASLLVSLSFIPLSLGLLRARASGRLTTAGRLVAWLRQSNGHLLDVVVHRPRLSMTVCVLLLLGSLAGLVLVPVNFLPLPNEGVLLDSFTLPPGTALPDTEAAVETLIHRLRRDPAVAHVFARVGSPSNTAYTEPAYAGEIQVVLKHGVAVSALDAIGNRLLVESRMPAVQASIDTPTIERLGESLSGLPQPFVVRLYGSSVATLRALSEKVAVRLRQLPRLSDVFNNDAYPVTQLRIAPDMNALNAYGITPARFYQQIQLLLAGKVIAEVPHGAYYLDLYMRLPGAPELSLGALRDLPIRTAGQTPLGQLATVSLETTPNQIRHIDGARALDILATPNGTPGAAIGAAKQAVRGLHLPAGYRIGFGGLYPELEHNAVGLAIAAVAAFVLMAAILLLQFDGALVPGLLLLEIPLAFTGGAFALTVSGVGLNATGMIAFLTLIGVGLNHGIVLLDRARRNEAAGMSPEAATREAVQVRFRPILLTTLTAVAGMLPTALGWGKGAAPEQGLALVILGGIIGSALLSTNLLPGLYIYWRGHRIARLPGKRNIAFTQSLKHGFVGLVLLLAGCASYHAVPLARRARLASSVAALNRTVPKRRRDDPPMVLAADQPFTIDQVGLLAILNDPDLVAQRAKLDQARATLLTAAMLPNPSIGLGFGALLGGPASTPSYVASIAEDVRRLITHHANVAAARADVSAVDASLLWQEWQVAEQARLLAAQIHGYDRGIAYRARELRLLRNELQAVRRAAAHGTLDLKAEAPLLSATASAEASLASARLTRLKAWQDLDALLGLQPSVRFVIRTPRLPPVPTKLEALIATLPARRPDLVALRLGYQAQEERVRAAILGQFPALSLGGKWESDTSAVRTAGPTLAIELPIFNRNQGNIASSRATRAVLHAQYQADLDKAEATVRSLVARLAALQADLRRAKSAAASTGRLARNAEQAYARGNLDQRSLTDYQTAALERELAAAHFQTQYNADRLALAIELGMGFPTAGG